MKSDCEHKFEVTKIKWETRKIYFSIAKDLFWGIVPPLFLFYLLESGKLIEIIKVLRS